MKRVTTILLACLLPAMWAFAQDENKEYVMFENTRLVVKTDSYKAFGEAMANHNKKFHADGPYHANVWSVSVGANAGQMVWSMGPCTFTHLDGRPAGDDHMEDWLGNVMPHVKYIAESNYWKMNEKLTFGEGLEDADKLSIRVYDIADGDWYRAKEVIKKVIEVYEAKEYDWNFRVYYPMFDVNEGEDMAIVTEFKSWAVFDDEPNFKADYEEVHGEGSWSSFRDEVDDVFKGSQDEVWELIPSLSGGGE